MTTRRPTEKPAAGVAVQPGPAPVQVPGKDTVTSQVLVLARRLQGDFLHRIRKTGLTPSQANVLRELALYPDIAQHELAVRLEIGKVSVGEALIKLEEAGYVHRERHRGNQRVVRVKLSPLGEVALQELARAAHAQLDQLRAQLGDEALTRLTDLLLQMNEVMQTSWAIGDVE